MAADDEGKTFVERVILCGLKELSWVGVSEHLLRHENTGMEPEKLALDIANRYELRLSTEQWEGRTRYRFERIE